MTDGQTGIITHTHTHTPMQKHRQKHKDKNTKMQPSIHPFSSKTSHTYIK